MSHEHWKKKYLKYKTKYLALQSGGNLVFRNFATEYRLQKLDNEKDTYKGMQSTSTRFSSIEHDAIEDFVNVILPECGMNSQLFGTNVSKEIKVMHYGSFGVTVYYNNLLIKIIRNTHGIDDKYKQECTNEILVHKYLSDGASPNVRDILDDNRFISAYYGYMTANDALDAYITDQLKRKGLHTNSILLEMTGRNRKSSYRVSLSSAILHIPRELKNDIDVPVNTSNSLLYIFSEKGEQNAITFFEDKSIHLTSSIIRLVSDITHGLRYMHRSGFIHNDIKLGNIIFTKEPAQHFQLIDFGTCLEHTMNDKPVLSDVGTLAMFEDSAFGRDRSCFYDWHCLYISILLALGAAKYASRGIVYSVLDKKYANELDNQTINSFTNSKYTGSIHDFVYRTLKYVGVTDTKIMNRIRVLSYAQECHNKIYHEGDGVVNIIVCDVVGGLLMKQVDSERAYEELLFADPEPEPVIPKRYAPVVRAPEPPQPQARTPPPVPARPQPIQARIPPPVPVRAPQPIPPPQQYVLRHVQSTPKPVQQPEQPQFLRPVLRHVKQ